jgi:hypothetical protein
MCVYPCSGIIYIYIYIYIYIFIFIYIYIYIIIYNIMYLAVFQYIYISIYILEIYLEERSHGGRYCLQTYVYHSSLWPHAAAISL